MKRIALHSNSPEGDRRTMVQGSSKKRSPVAVLAQHAASVDQRRIGEAIQQSPRLVAQRKQIWNLFGGAVQSKASMEEELQKKADPTVLQRMGQEEKKNLTSGEHAIQKVAIGTINCPNWGNVMDLGSAIHSTLQADYIANGSAAPGHPTWVRGAEFTTPTGQKADISLRTPATNLIRSIGEIKPVASQAAGAAQIAAHLANMPANGLNAVQPVIVDPAWTAGASFPVTNLDVAGVSPSGNVNVTPVAATPGLYTYDG